MNQSQTSNSKSGYIPGLDGIRAIAVIAVILYHLNPRWVGGGFMGVNVFFTLSGYLICRLLLQEQRRERRISLVHFYLRRAKRLIPATLSTIALTALAAAIISPYLLTKLKGDLLPTLLFVNNWHQIFAQNSYFGGLGLPSPLTHFWSLAIEEQFYFILPITLIACFALRLNKRVLCALLGIITFASALAMMILYTPGADPTRVYYGTDTRAFALLIGVLWAIATRPWPLTKERQRPSFLVSLLHMPLVCELIALISLAIFVWLCLGFNGASAFPYYGGFILCSIATLGLIDACVRRTAITNTLLSLPPLTHLGKISYGLYLIHYPVILLLTPTNSATDTPFYIYIAQVLITLVIAELSYFLVEKPIRQLKTFDFKRVIPQFIYLGLVCAATVAAMIMVPDTQILGQEELASMQETDGQATEEAQVADGSNSDSQAAAADMFEGTSTDEAINNMKLRAQSIIAAQTYAREHGYTTDDRSDEQKEFDAKIAAMPWDGSAYNVVQVGDSVSTGLTSIFNEAFPNSYINAKWARKFDEGMAILKDLDAQGKLGNIVILQLGTNGYLTDDIIAEAMDYLGSERAVWFISTRSPEFTIDWTNEALARATEKYPNMHYMDWYNLSAGHGEYLVKDGIHLTSEGAQVYLAMIANAIRWELPGLN